MSRKNEGETKRKSASKLREGPVASSTASKSTSTPSRASGSSVDLDNLGELPRSYGSDTIFLIAQEPHWLFTYWDIDISRHPGGQTFLRVYEGEETIEAEIEVPFETRNWYIPVKSAGAKYTVEIGYNRGNVWNVIARSYTIETPKDHLSESDQFDYATIPLHLSFQKLMEGIQHAMQSGETLITALSRLQKEGKLFAFGSGAIPGISIEQRIILEALLGSNFVEELASGGLSSQQLEERVRKHLEEKLSSQGPLSSFSAQQWGAAESSLFSALGALSSQEVSGWGPAELSSWAAGVCRVGRPPAEPPPGGAANRWAVGRKRRNRVGASQSYRVGSREPKAAGYTRRFQAGCRLRKAAGPKERYRVGSREPKAAGHKPPYRAGSREPKAAGRSQRFQAGCKERKAAGHKGRFQAGCRLRKAAGPREPCRAGSREPKAAGRRQPFQVGARLP